MEIYYTIVGNPITKKNHSQIVRNGAGRPFVIPSKQYKKYEEEAGWQLKPRPTTPINKPVNVRCVYYMATKRRVDLVNLIEATCDILVKHGILEDDNSNIVVSHDGSCVKYDKIGARAEITITEV